MGPFFLLLAIPSISAVLPDTPKVEVPKDVLLRAGVKINPNAPGLFNKLMENVTAGDAIQKIQSQPDVTVIVNGDQLSIPQFFTFLLASPVNEHAQFAIAHMINIYYRLYNFTGEFDRKLMTSLTKYHAANATTSFEICRSDLFLQRVARLYTRDFNITTSCSLFQRLLSRNLIISKMISDVSFAEQSLHVQHTLLDSPITIAEIKIFMMTAPHLPTIMQGLYDRQLNNLFTDYITFINRIEGATEGEKALKQLLSMLKFVLLHDLKSYWDVSRGLAA